MKNMKMNKWTMGLAAAGVVTLSSVAQAQDAAAGAEALAASTTLSGYVSTGYKYNNGAAGLGYFRAAEDRNAFSLDVVDLKLSSAQGDGAMDTGYTVELWMGPAAGDIGTADTGVTDGTVELMQANIDLRLNGIDLKVGQFGTVVGNEVYNYNENAFYTHSWGFAMEPTHHTGILASYTVSDDLQIGLGLANSTTAAINANSTGSSKTVLASVSYTLPSGTGALAGTELYYGFVSGDADGVSGDNDEYHYASVALPELVANLTTKVVWDHVEHVAGGDGAGKTSDIVGLYLSYSLNDTTTLNIRGEMGNLNTDTSTVTGGNGTVSSLGTGNADNLQSWTIGLNHKIWDNVISRIEYRHDEVDNTSGDTSDNQQDVVALNLIYTF
ncbi:porin [Verrucomicrobia bacterium]|nr:porin [Verrucomicrobiota bacterium]